jgi:hypothetical protein
VTKPEHRTERPQFKDFLYEKYFISSSVIIGEHPIPSKIYYLEGILGQAPYHPVYREGQILPINFKSEKTVSFSDKETNMAVTIRRASIH